MDRTTFARSAACIVLLVGAAGAPCPARAGSLRPPHVPRHVVVIIQENRTVDNLFLGFPGAETQAWGLNSKNERVPLRPMSLRSAFDPTHTHESFAIEFNRGDMNGWDRDPTDCDPGPCEGTPFAYVPQSETKPYWQLASQFALADAVLQPNEGPSYPAHQYLIAGQSGRPFASAENPTHRTGGCNVPEVDVLQIDLRLPYPGREGRPVFPCRDYLTIFDLLERRGHSWRYYTPSLSSIWSAPVGVWHLYESRRLLRNVVTPETEILGDIRAHRLADVSYVIPRRQFSDHPGGRVTAGGPDWVGTVVNAIGTNPFYWRDTTVLITWDDWGGWFDHYRPRHPALMPTDPYEYGFRVPLIAVSPYVKRAHLVSHHPRDATSILRFIEYVYNLPSLGQLDALTDGFSDMFNFSATEALPYHAVDSRQFTANYFLSLPPDDQPLDP